MNNNKNKTKKKRMTNDIMKSKTWLALEITLSHLGSLEVNNGSI
tara:strand:- start:288 stop:419 length:132 start_codon:yes stop_codon:yes gene_type:complete